MALSAGCASFVRHKATASIDCMGEQLDLPSDVSLDGAARLLSRPLRLE